MKTLRFTTLPGDGIGPEVMEVALKVLDALGSKHGFCTESTTHTPEESESTTTGKPCFLHPVRLRTSRRYSFRLGRRTEVGKPSTQATARTSRPPPLAQGFRALCQSTPGQPHPELADLSPLRPQTVANGIDVSLRSRTYRRSLFRPTQATETLDNGELEAIDTMVYRSGEIERIIEIAVRAASLRGVKSVRWTRRTTRNLRSLEKNRDRTSPCTRRSIELSHMYADNAAMQLVATPTNSTLWLPRTCSETSSPTNSP